VALPPIAYLTKIKNWEKQSTELLISREYNWLYDPAINRNRWLSFSKICPEIFQKGNCKQSIDNQFWGTVNNGQSPFWMACFEYTISSGRSSATYKNLVYAFRLPNNITADFRLTPQNAFTELSAKIHSTLTTESVDFNKEFHVGYKGNENLVGPEILQVLNPSAQEKIMNFRNTCGQFTLAFKQNVMFVAFEKDLKLQYTSFLKKVALDERDSQSIAHNLLSTIELADTILSSISG
jgi:hypothetical protein